MFGKQELEFRIAELQDDIAALKKNNDEVKQKQRNVAYDDIDGSVHAFDWEAVGAFSIERNMRYEHGELEAYTVIGFIRADGGTGEWSFICSQEEHNRLAKEFQAYLASKKPVKAAAKPTLLTETKPAIKGRK